MYGLNYTGWIDYVLLCKHSMNADSLWSQTYFDFILPKRGYGIFIPEEFLRKWIRAIGSFISQLPLRLCDFCGHQMAMMLFQWKKNNQRGLELSILFISRGPFHVFLKPPVGPAPVGMMYACPANLLNPPFLPSLVNCLIFGTKGHTIPYLMMFRYLVWWIIWFCRWGKDGRVMTGRKNKLHPVLSYSHSK